MEMLEVLMNLISFGGIEGIHHGFLGGLIGAMTSLAGASMQASAQEHGANLNYKANKERVAGDNMRQAIDAEKKATTDHLGAVQRNTAGLQDTHKDIVNVMRDTYLRNAGMGGMGKGRKL
jgi:hypothetical protein